MGEVLKLDTIEHAVDEIRAGRPVIVVDDEDRENEGDLVFAASKATPELLAFLIRYSSGVVCVPMEAAELDRFGIPLMTPHNRERLRTAYTISVDARDKGDDRDLGGRPGADDPRAGRFGVGVLRPGAARAHLPAAGSRGRRTGSSWAHRGVAGSRADRRAAAVGGDR